MIILTSNLAGSVRGISPYYGYSAINPRLLTDGTFVLPEDVLADPYNRDVLPFLDGLTQRTVASNEYETNSALLAAVPNWRTVGVRQTLNFFIDSNVPEGTDDGIILYTITQDSGPYTFDSGGTGLALDGEHVIIDDKITFFGRSAWTTVVSTDRGFVSIDWTVTAGHYDIGLFDDNIAGWWDMGDHRQFTKDEIDPYVETWNDKSSYDRRMHNPWFLDRRPQLIDSQMGVARKTALNKFDNTGSRYGLGCPEHPVTYGMRYVLMTSSTVALTRAEVNNNNEKTTFTGLSSVLSALLNNNILVVVYGDATTCTLRINGVERGSKTTTTGYTAPANKFLWVFAGRPTGTVSTSYNVIMSPNHVGQHPFWEGNAFGGELAEIFQLWEVSVSA